MNISLNQRLFIFNSYIHTLVKKSHLSAQATLLFLNLCSPPNEGLIKHEHKLQVPIMESIKCDIRISRSCCKLPYKPNSDADMFDALRTITVRSNGVK